MASMIHRNGARDRARHVRLGQLLRQQDAILRNHKQMLRAGQPTAMSGVLDAEEHSLDAEERDVGLWLAALTSQKVRGIETALRRLAAGNFGRCSDCWNAISGARLRAQPFATLCLACQQRHEIASASRWSSRQHEA